MDPDELAGVVLAAGVEPAGAAGMTAEEGAGAAAGASSGGGVSRPEGGLEGAIAFCASAPGVCIASSAETRQGAVTRSKARQGKRLFMVKLGTGTGRVIMS